MEMTTPNNNEAERAAFEAFLGLDGAYKFRNADGSYQVIDTQRAWFIWQGARRAAPVAEGVALPPLPEPGIDVFRIKGFTAEQVRQAQRDAIAPYAERIRLLEREHGLLSMVVEQLKERLASADALIESMATKADRRAYIDGRTAETAPETRNIFEYKRIGEFTAQVTFRSARACSKFIEQIATKETS